MENLIEHIKAENEKTRLWVNESPETRFASLFTENPRHWREMGIESVEQFKAYLDAENEKEQRKANY